MERIKGCVIGLKNKRDIINTLYELINQIDLDGLRKRKNLVFSVLKYYDNYRERDFFALIFWEKENSCNTKETEEQIIFKNKINTKYFGNTWDIYYFALTKHAKKIIDKSDLKYFNLSGKVIYVEQNKKLVVNEITDVMCHRIKLEDLVFSIYKIKINPGIYDLKDEIIKKITNKELYNKIEELVNKNWNPTSVE